MSDSMTAVVAGTADRDAKSIGVAREAGSESTVSQRALVLCGGRSQVG